MRLGFAAMFVMACSSSPSDESGWMAGLDDARSLADLSIPGTHDSGALFEPYAGVAKAQDLTIADQLTAGIRYFDIRCGQVDAGYLIYHGSIYQQQAFDDVMTTMSSFLDAHPGETVIMSVKEEVPASDTTLTFEQTFQSYVAMDPDRWYLGATVPALGDVRGQLVLLRRFDAVTSPLGIDATAWPDNMTFAIDNAASIRIQDDYMVTDNNAKWTAITGLIDEARVANPSPLFLDYTSGYQTVQGIPDITLVSDDIDARLDDLLAAPETAGAHLGVLVMDHVTEARATGVIETNSTP
jgi:1-phosphatidylinositol phosphodiesterase